MSRSRASRRQHRKNESTRKRTAVDTGAITRMVANGEANPFPMGSREHIAFAFADELKREAASDSETPLARQARRIFPTSPATTRRVARADADAAATELPAVTPPIPARKPEQVAAETSPVAAPPTPTSKPKVPIAEIWTDDQLLPVSKEFADRIAEAENTFDNWGEVSRSSSGVGRYQMLASGLIDIGLMRDRETWTLNGLPDRDELLANPDLQNLAFSAFLEKKLQYLNNLDLTDFVGQEITGIVDTFEITEAGLFAAAHREGEGRLRQYLRHLEDNEWVSDADTFPTTKMSDERTMAQIFKAIETRLRLFSTVPLYASDDVAPLNELRAPL